VDEEPPRFAATVGVNRAGIGLNVFIEPAEGEAQSGRPTINADQRVILARAAGIARRRLETHGIRWPSDMDILLQCLTAELVYEVSYALGFCKDWRLVSCDQIARGTVDSVPRAPTELVREAILRHARYVVVAHNHPSDTAEPSDQDEIACRYMRNACRAVGLVLVDDLIVTKQAVASMRELRKPPGCWGELPDIDKDSADAKEAGIEPQDITDAAPTALERAAYEEAHGVLALLAAFRGRPLTSMNWAVGSLRLWARQNENVHVAGLAIDVGGRVVSCGPVPEIDGLDSRALLQRFLRFAVITGGKSFAFSIRTDSAEVSHENHLAAIATQLMLKDFDLELLDVLLVWPSGMQSLRGSGFLDRPPLIG
jgi:hypothetical protein